MCQFYQGKQNLSHRIENVLSKEKILKITERQHAYITFDTLIMTEHEGDTKKIKNTSICVKLKAFPPTLLCHATHLIQLKKKTWSMERSSV